MQYPVQESCGKIFFENTNTAPNRNIYMIQMSDTESAQLL